MAAATMKMISDWFRRGVQEKADYMIVVCDSFDYEDYPVYVSTEKFWEKYKEFDGENMQRIMEVYNLKMDRNSQVGVWQQGVQHTPENRNTAGSCQSLGFQYHSPG